jgi:hypothetical protein
MRSNHDMINLVMAELSKRGYYNNVKFHRIIKDFMIQGGVCLCLSEGADFSRRGFDADDSTFTSSLLIMSLVVLLDVVCGLS